MTAWYLQCEFMPLLYYTYIMLRDATFLVQLSRNTELPPSTSKKLYNSILSSAETWLTSAIVGLGLGFCSGNSALLYDVE